MVHDTWEQRSDEPRHGPALRSVLILLLLLVAMALVVCLALPIVGVYRVLSS
jgi:hypothetical protein